MEFNHEQLPDLYEGVRIGNGIIGSCYIFSNQKGDFMELFILHNQTQWKFIIDNFPRQRKYYSTNIPYRTVEDFEHDLVRMGIEPLIKK